MACEHIVILTGAGISAESGLLTFRDNGGLWCNHRIEDVATPEAFERNPALVHEFYNMRRAQLKDVAPNAAHEALGRLQKAHASVTIITQNVDDLHERAGAGVMHMHGELNKIRCDHCRTVTKCDTAISEASHCQSCLHYGGMRPHIVWFGEMPFYMDAIEKALAACDLFISIGTSGNVYPAAGFVRQVLGRAHTVELNLEPSLGGSLFHEKIYGKASEIVPAYVNALLG